ncbi:MAG: hypothetical protein RMJ07_02585 [Nitrososphaerota archaeon]|nr:hypothetical protein [Candidatus Bathyarchaeota archaeon]MDW8048554.1 hypothetical protein [Nitrososphaerota archaeon]
MEYEERDRSAKEWAKIIAARIMRAAFWGLIMGGEMLIILNVTQIGRQFLPEQQASVTQFLLLSVAFEVAIQLLKGTFIPYLLSAARTLIFMALLVMITSGGMLEIPFQPSQGMPFPSNLNITVKIDFKPILSAILLFSSLSIIKNILQLIEFLSEREEEPMTPPETS